VVGRKVLILGGTSEAMDLASRLVAGDTGWRVISSLAGRVANPRLPPGEVRVGGFGGGAGLAAYLRQENIAAMVDATHPFARRMGWNAAEAAAHANVPLLRLGRPAWVPQPGDRWVMVDDWDQAVAHLRGRAHRVFLALGRQELAPFTALDDVFFVIRSVDAPDPSLHFAQAELILARGPFRLEDERALLRAHRIDCIVCKNSGGTATDGKLIAARELGIEVIMQSRPPRPDAPAVPDVAAAIDWLRTRA
jgi:precorrin-6A/cobalt-precorrin-6A reductase